MNKLYQITIYLNVILKIWTNYQEENLNDHFVSMENCDSLHSHHGMFLGIKLLAFSVTFTVKAVTALFVDADLKR